MLLIKLFAFCILSFVFSCSPDSFDDNVSSSSKNTKKSDADRGTKTDDDSPLDDATDKSTNNDVKLDQLKNIATADLYDPVGTINNKNKVLLYVQGGPLFELTSDSSLQNKIGDMSHIVDVLKIHQVQTLNAHFKTADIISSNTTTFSNIQKMAYVSVNILYKVAKHFKDAGKEVLIFGTSYGFFIIAHLIHQYGVDVFDKASLSIGRLDMDRGVEQFLKNGVSVSFPADNNYRFKSPYGGMTIKSSKVSWNFFSFDGEIARSSSSTRNSYEIVPKLQGAYGINEYTKLLKGKDLSKVQFTFGAKDVNVGSLLPVEKEFLKGKNYYIDEDSGHTASPHLDRIKDFLGLN